MQTPKAVMGSWHTRRPDTIGRVGEQRFTVNEVAELLRLSRKGVYSLAEQRRLPFVRVSNRVRFLQSDVLEWLRENRVPAMER